MLLNVLIIRISVAVSREFDTESWYDPMTDSIYVRVRRSFTDGSGDKKGIIVRISEESLMQVAEGQEYPQIDSAYHPDKVRWELVNDDTE